MKITKIDGISHKKYKENGRLVKNNKSDDIIEERFKEIENKTKELFEKTLDFYIKNPEKCEEHNKNRRQNLKIFFKKIKIKVDKNDKIEIIYLKEKNDEKLLEDFNYTDVRNKKYLNILEKISKKETLEESEKEVFEKDLLRKLKNIDKIKKSLIENKAHFKKIENNKVKGGNKRSFFYEYYRSSSKCQEYINNIKDAFEKLYEKKEIDDLKEEIEKGSVKNKIREKYKKILERNRINIDKEKYEKVILKEKIEDVVKEIPDLKDLTKSQIFYKYFLGKEELDEENIKYCFYHFVEIEINNLLKNNVYSNESKNKNSKINKIFEYDELKKIVKNKLLNKLNNYIRNCGKYDYYQSDEDTIIESDEISEMRVREAFLRNLIGLSSSVYFSLRNILDSNNKSDISNDNQLNRELNAIYQDNIKIEKFKNKLRMFYGDYFKNYDINGKKNNIKEFIKNINNINASIRHNIIHFNNNFNSENIFEFNDINLGIIGKDIFEKEINKENMKTKIFKQLNSSNILDCLDEKEIYSYLSKIKFSFINRNIPFVPSFTKVYERIQNLKNTLQLRNSWKISDDSDIKNAQIYLLKNIYYGKFLDEFLDNDKGNFLKIKDEVIELNKNSGKNVESGNYKYRRFENVENGTSAREYLQKIQSLYMIHNEEMKDEEENIFLDFIQRIFLKGFSQYIEKNYSNLLNLEKKQDKKAKIDKELENNNLSETTKKIIDKIQIDDSIMSFNTEKVKAFYLLLKTLNYKELTNLKGALEKYQISNNTKIFENELILLNIVNLDNNKLLIKDFELLPNEIGIFLDKVNNKKIKTFEELREFEKLKEKEYSDIYSDYKNIKNNRNFYNMKKYSMVDLLNKISNKANYKVKKYDIERYVELKKELENKETDFFKKQRELHLKYQRKMNKIKENESKYKKYQEVVKKIEQYVHLKNKIEFNDLNLLQSILLRILHRLVGYTSIWERDLRFRLKSEFTEETDIENIFNHRKEYKGENGQITKKYEKFIKDHPKYKDNLVNKGMENIKLQNNGNYIRNYIAHFNYLPEPEYSILDMIKALRELLNYDRKLKNSVMKSIKNILEEYGFVSEFIIDKDKNIILKKIKSMEIKHLNNNNIKSYKCSKKLCELIKTMFEYKKQGS